MLENQTIPGITPDVVRLAKEQEEKEEKKKAEARVIEEIDENFSLFSWGYSEPLKITRGNKVEYIRLKIKSVGISEVIEELQAKAPTPPSVPKVYKKDSDIARQLGYKHDVVVREVDEADPEYQRLKRQHDMISSQMILLHGLAYDLKYNGQVVLRGSDITAPSEIIDAEKALLVLKRWGLSSEAFATLVKNIRELTEAKEVAEEGES